MDGEQNGATQTQQDAQQQEAQQEAQQQEGQGSQPGAGNTVETDDAGARAYEEQLAERDKRIAELEAQVADAAKTAEAAEALRGEIAELKAQGESERVDFRLQLAGVRNVKAARAVLDEHGGDIDALKAAEPWLFAEAPQKQAGKTGLPNAGTATDEGKQLKRWEKLAGLDDESEN